MINIMKQGVEDQLPGPKETTEKEANMEGSEP
jgi:hypothetical protein